MKCRFQVRDIGFIGEDKSFVGEAISLPFSFWIEMCIFREDNILPYGNVFSLLRLSVFFGRMISSPTVRCERFPLRCIAVHCNTFTHTKKAWSIFIGQAFRIHTTRQRRISSAFGRFHPSRRKLSWENYRCLTDLIAKPAWISLRSEARLASPHFASLVILPK